MKLTLTIKSGNQAMQTSEDFADLLRRVSFDIEEHGMIELVSMEGCSPVRKSLHDENGNVVGLLSIIEE